MTDLAPVERSAHSALLSFADLDEQIAAALPEHQRDAWHAYRADWQRGAVERPCPLHLDFTLNRSCNLRCPMCTWSDPDAAQGPRSDWMTLAFYKHVLAEAVPLGLKAVGLNGINEPLIRRDLPDFVRAAKDAGVLDVMLHTNGTLLTPTMSADLIDAGLTRLMVSLDAATPETYDKIRVGADLGTVEHNIHEFYLARGVRRLPVLGVCFVRMAVNAHEETAFIEKWRGLADFFSIQSYLNPWAGRVDKDALAAPDWRPSSGFTCAQPFQRMRVNEDFAVRPCCSFVGERAYVGSAQRESIDTIWHGGPMRRLRALHAAGRGMEDPICRDCMTHSFTQEAP